MMKWNEVWTVYRHSGCGNATEIIGNFDTIDLALTVATNWKERCDNIIAPMFRKKDTIRIASRKLPIYR